VKHHSFINLILTSISFFMQPLIPVFATGERELVAVIAARVRYGLSQRAEMPDTPPNLQLRNLLSSPKIPGSLEGNVVTASDPAELDVDSDIQKLMTDQAQEIGDLEAELKETTVRNDELSRSVEKLVRELIELKGKQALLPAGGVIGSPLPGEAVNSAPPPAVSLKLASSVGSSVADIEPYEVIVGTAAWCGHCPRFKNANGSGDGSVHLRYVDVDQPKPADIPQSWWDGIRANSNQGLPMPTWIDGRGQMLHMHGANLTSAAILATIEYPKNNPPVPRRSGNTAAAAVGGTIQTGGWIATMLSLWEDRLGHEATASVKWDRTGLQSLSATKLIHGESWTPSMVAGSFGHVSLQTTSTRLPMRIQQFGFTYRTLDNSNFQIDADTLTVTLPNTLPARIAAAQSYGFLDPISIGFDVYQCFSILHQILNPQIDVGLEGTVELTAKMSGKNKLVITFNECPSIRVAAWVRFDLDVQRVELTPTNIHVAFKPQPQNWIQIESRDFSVIDDASR